MASILNKAVGGLQKQQTMVKVEIPFDLNKIFSLTYEFQPLKEILEYLFRELQKNGDRIHQVDTKLVSKFMALDKVKNDFEDLKKDIKKMKEIDSELEQKSIAHDQELSKINADLEVCLMNFALLQRQTGSIPGRMYDVEDKIEDFSKRITELEEKIALLGPGGGGGGSGTDLEGLNKLLKSYLKKSDLDDLYKRVEKCEKKSKKAKDKAKSCKEKIEKWEPKWNQMQQDIEELKKLISNKVDCQFFDDEMEKMRNLINALQGKDIKAPIVQSGPSLSSKELNEFKEALKKIVEHEDKITKLQQDLKGINIESIIKRLNSISEEMKSKADKSEIFRLETEKAEKIYVEEEFKRVWREIESLKTWLSQMDDTVKFLQKSASQSGGISLEQLKTLIQRIDKLDSLVASLQKQIDELKSAKPVMTQTATMNFAETRESLEDFKDVNSRLNQLQMGLDQLRNEFAKWIKEMQDSLNTKLDMEQLSNFEKLIMEKINEIVKALIKQLADKNDTKKALKLLERQLKNLYDLFMSRGHTHNENEDDAMFTKKPLGGMSCASCEKDIINLQGKKADFLPWNKFPFRDPNERIAKVGQGFSKMLSMINPDAISRYEQQNKFSTLGPGQVPHLSQKGSQEQFYSTDELQDQVNTDPQMLRQQHINSQGKTQQHFYQSQQQQAQDMSKRPGSAQVIPRPRVKNNFTKNGTGVAGNSVSKK